MMKDTTIEARLAELESRLAFQDITIEELNQTVTAHELEMAKMRDLMRLLTEKVKATQSSHIASQAEETPPPHY
ncbi:slyX family protein [Enterobacter hormaechei subsp. hoffmannii]|nr:slyX family protein [Enterobacter hormaechei subsp. hoffmannii]